MKEISETIDNSVSSTESRSDFNCDNRNDENLNSKLNEFDTVSYAEMKLIIRNLNNNKGTKLDINAKIVKLIWESDPNIILDILNQSLRLGITPDIWKLSTITPLQKIKNNKNIEVFRPINTLPIMEQLLEEVVKSRLEKYLESNDLIDNEQYGLRKYYSCETAIQSSLIDW